MSKGLFGFFIFCQLIILMASGPTTAMARLYECHQAKRAIEEHLRDPDSAQFQCLDMIQAKGGQVLPVRVNAKNAFGGFTGWELWGVVFMPDGSITAFSPEMMKAAGLH